MKFGFFVEWPNPGLRDWRTVFNEGLEQIQYAEEMGYDFVFIAEHHFSNYGMTPAPLVAAAHIAQKTKRIKLVTTCLVLPEWPALRLAEEVAVLDNLTEGRFICGIGRGYQPYEFARHGVTIEDSHQRFKETLDVLRLAWTRKEAFTYEGQHVRVPNPVTVWPKPLQTPHPPLWMATASEAQIAMCAREDIVPMSSARFGPQSIEPAAVAWVQGRADAGKDIQDLELAMQAPSGCAETEAEARALMKHFMWQMRAGKALNAQSVCDGEVQVVPYEGENTEEQSWERHYFGTPDRLIERYTQAAKHGATIVSTWMMAGDIPHEKVMNSLRLMGRDVIPAVKDARPDPKWIESLVGRPRAAAPTTGKLGSHAE